MPDLSEPERACLALAWEAMVAGTNPVGAVVVDGAGTISCRRPAAMRCTNRPALVRCRALTFLGADPVNDGTAWALAHERYVRRRPVQVTGFRELDAVGQFAAAA